MEAITKDPDEPPTEVSCNYNPMNAAQSITSSISGSSPYRPTLRQEATLECSPMQSSKDFHSEHTYLANYPPLPPFSPTRILPSKKSRYTYPCPPSMPITTPLGSGSGSNGKGNTGSNTNTALINSLRYQIISLRQHVEELSSSESLIVGEQKMLIQKLQAVEPKRVKFLLKELDASRSNFVNLLEGQIVKIAEMQLGLNKVRKDGEGNARVILEDEVSEIVDYEGEIQMSRKNIFLLRTILERRTSALMDEVDKLKGIGVRGLTRIKGNGSPETMNSGGLVHEDEIDSPRNEVVNGGLYRRTQEGEYNRLPPTNDRDTGINTCVEDDACGEHVACDEPKTMTNNLYISNDEGRNSSYQSFKDTLDGFLQVDDSPSISDQMSVMGYEDGGGISIDGDDGESEEDSTLQQLEQHIDTLQKEKESEIGELRSALAQQNHLFHTRMFEMQMKIEHFQCQQIRKHGMHDTRINVLEQENEMLRKSINPVHHSFDLNASRQSMSSPFGVSPDKTVQHDNLSDEGMSARVTEDTSVELNTESQTSEIDSSAGSGDGDNQQTVETVTIISTGPSNKSAESLTMAEKDRRIELLQNELGAAKRVIEDVESTLKAYGCNDESQPLLRRHCSRATSIDHDCQELQKRKTLSWVKRQIVVLKRKGEAKRKKSNSKYDHVDRQFRN